MKIIAHRGLSGFYPENTMLAFKKCLSLDIYGVELDVHKTKDNHLVVIHDETVNRTLNGDGYVKDMTLLEIQSLSCSIKNFEDNKDCCVPTLREVLELFKPTNFIINIELKNNKIKYKNIERDVVTLIEELGMQRRVLISSFRMKSIKICKKLNSKIPRAYLLSDKFYKYRIKPLIFCKLEKNSCLYVNPSSLIVDKSFVKKCRHRDIQILSYTVNKIAEFKRLKSLGVDGVFTDFPRILSSLEND